MRTKPSQHNQHRVVLVYLSDMDYTVYSNMCDSDYINSSMCYVSNREQN